MVIRLFHFAISLIVLTPAIIKAEPCIEKNLYKIPNSPFNKMTIHDQDGARICYSYTATQLINYSLISQGKFNAPVVNPIHAAWTTYYKNPIFFKSKNLVGGEVTDVINALNEEGICLNSDVNKILSELNKNTNMSEAQILASLDLIYETKYKPSQSLANKINQVAGVYSKNQCSLGRPINYRALIENIKTLGLEKKSSTEILEKLFDSCKNQKIKIPEIEEKFSGSDEEFAKLIENQLTQNNPIVASVCSPVLTNASTYRGLCGLPIRKLDQINYGSDCKPHSVLIVGSKLEKFPNKEDNQCLYLVRNSWGTFNRPATAQACACYTRNREYKDNCKENEVSKYVGCWYRKEDIVANTTDLEYLK